MMANLAGTNEDDPRQFGEVMKMHQRILKTSSSILGEAHPTSLARIRRVAALTREEGMFERAEGMVQAAYGKARSVLGKEHPQTFECMLELSVIYRLRGKWMSW